MTNRIRRHEALLGALAGVLFLISLLPGAPLASAGTQDAPEITDPVDDQSLTPAGTATGQDCVANQAACPTFARIDILKLWIDTETATTFNVNILVNGVPGAPTTHSSRWTFSGTVAGTTIASTAQANGGSTTTPPAPTGNVAAVAVAGNVLIMTIDKAIYGSPAAGASLDIFALGHGLSPPPSPATVLATDRAPNTGVVSYIFTGGAVAGGNSTGILDTDADGLNDTWEVEQFGNITLQNGTGDPDADGLNNSAEFTAGTNATNPDTDGDLVNDGEDSAPLDPNVPAVTNTTDRDNDTLPDVWERQYFNGTTAQNATGDPDGDGLNNSAEFIGGTAPNKADSDGDGVNDKADAFPLDATKSSNTSAASATYAKPELYAGAGMFAAAATFCLLGLARIYP